MASRCSVSPNMGLLEPQPPKPQPLRIIKRSQTVTGCCLSSPTFTGPRGRISGSSTQGFDESFNVGSPPFGADRPLTVHKLRKKRASVLDGLADCSSDDHIAASTMISSSSERYSSTEDDLDLTPKAAKPVPRTFSAGAFLHSEFHHGTSGALLTQPQSLNIPRKRRINSKNFFLKAISGRGSIRSELSPEYHNDSGIPPRRMSGRSSLSASMHEGGTSSVITRSALVLHPEITITPEVRSIESSSCSLWAGISIAAKLSRADGGLGTQNNMSNLETNHGKLHSMRIEIYPGKDCLIREIVGNLNEPRTVNLGETILILAKVRIGRKTLPFSSGSEELIADLESQLGNSVSHYISVQVTYNHSGFRDTKMQTHANGSIKRHNAHSAWVVAQPENPRLPSNPVIVLIETHFPLDKARQAIRRLSQDRIRIPLAKRPFAAWRSGNDTSDENMKVMNTSPLRIDNNDHEDPWCYKSVSIPQKYETFSSVLIAEPDLGEELDPARKIWTEMRRTSRGRNHRTSLSAGNYEPLETSLDAIDNVSQWVTNSNVEHEREYIRDVALRNKRSVGQDTLRSMAPSTKKGNVGALGLGKNWGWPAWW